MTKWAYNQLTMKTKDDFDKVVNTYIGGNGELDFNFIIPMPLCVKNTVSTSYKDILASITWFLSDKGKNQLNSIGTVINAIHTKFPTLPPLERTYKTHYSFSTIINDIKNCADDMTKVNVQQQDWNSRPKKPGPISFYDNGQNALESILFHDTIDWYDWAVLYWNTKWNARDTDVDEKSLSIYWETAWNRTTRLAALMTKGLDNPCYYQYAEERFTEYKGECIFEQGEIIAHNEPRYNIDAFILASQLIDPEQQCYRWNDKKGDIVTIWSFKNDEKKGSFDDYPVITHTTNMRRKFDAITASYGKQP